MRRLAVAVALALGGGLVHAAPSMAVEPGLALPTPPPDVLVLQDTACWGCPTVFYRAPADALEQREVLAVAPAGAVLSPGGDRVAHVRGSEVVVEPVRGGEPVVLAGLPSDEVTIVDWSDDGSTLLLVARVGSPPSRALVDAAYLLGTAPGAAPRQLLASSDAERLGVQSGMRFELGSAHRVVATGSSASGPVEGAPSYALGFSEAVYLLVEDEALVTLLPARPGFVTGTRWGTSYGSTVVMSPDRSLLVFHETGRLVSLPEGRDVPPVFVPPSYDPGAPPVFSTDSRWLYSSLRGMVVRHDLTGADEPQTLGEGLVVRAAAGAPIDPVRPRTLQAELRGSRVLLQWRAPRAAEDVTYRIDRYDGLRATGTPSTSRTGSLRLLESVAPGRTYTWVVTAIDGSGVLRGSATRSATAASVPRITAPLLASDVAASPGDSTFPMALGRGSHPSSGLDTAYGSGPYCGLDRNPGPQPTGITCTTPGPGEAVGIEVLGQDAFGNRTPVVSGTTTGPLDDAAATKRGRWTRRASRQHWAGTVSTSRTPGASLAFKVPARPEGGPVRRLVLVGDAGPRQGLLEVLVDGRRRAVVSTRSRASAVRRHLWTLRVDDRRHEVRIVARRGAVGIDGLGVAA